MANRSKWAKLRAKKKGAQRRPDQKHAGCEQVDLVAEFRRRGWLNGADPEKEPKQRRIIATFPYVDEAGDLLYEVVRFEPKAFLQRRPDGNGGLIWKLGDTRCVLYRLPELLDDIAAERTTFIVEGESKVALLSGCNLPATCNYIAQPKPRADRGRILDRLAHRVEVMR